MPNFLCDQLYASGIDEVISGGSSVMILHGGYLGFLELKIPNINKS